MQMSAVSERLLELAEKVNGVNSTADRMQSFVNQLLSHARQVSMQFAGDAHSHSPGEPVPLATALRAGEIRHRGMIGNDWY